MPYVLRNTAEIYYEQKGKWEGTNRIPVVLLHGNGESMEIFDKTLAPLLHRFAFLAIDSRGQGKSSITKNDDFTYPISYDIMCDDVIAVLDELGIKQCHIVGFSDGAIIALMLAMNEDTKMRIRRVVAISPNLSPEGIKKQSLLEIEQQRDAARQDGDAFTAQLYNMMLTEPQIPMVRLSTVYAQVAVVSGSKDMIKKEHIKQIADTIMYSRNVVIEGADHMIPQEYPDKLREIIVREVE